MVPLRNALIVKEHDTLPYPEGTACAEVLLAGEDRGTSARAVFAGMGISAAFKFVIDGLKAASGTITIPVRALRTEFFDGGLSCPDWRGYICGARISSYLFAGGILGWFVLIPAIVSFGGDTVLYPGSVSIAQMYAAQGAEVIWGSYIRYIGAGAVAAGGIISLVKSMPLITATFAKTIKDIKTNGTGMGAKTKRTESDINMKVVVTAIVLLILAIAFFSGYSSFLSRGAADCTVWFFSLQRYHRGW